MISESFSDRLSAIPSILDIGVEEIANGLDQNLFSSVDLVETYLARIEEVNPKLHAVIEVNPDALAIAKGLDDERKVSGRRGPLHGVPVLVKDNIVTLDKTETTSGSFCLLGAKPGREATVIQKLRQAGAIILGKSNMSEWANFRSYAKTSSDGWSPRGGQTYAPYGERQNPDGSSSGSAVAVAVGLVATSIGTETDGSIVCPAGESNVVSIKPTVGLTSRHSTIPGSFRQDTVGSFGKNVIDVAVMLSVMAGKDEFDPATNLQPFDKAPDYVAACNTSALVNARIGVPRNAVEDTSAVRAEFENALNQMKMLGATIVDNLQLETYDELQKLDTDQVLSRDFKDSLEDYFSTLETNPHGLKKLEDVLNLTKSLPEECYGEGIPYRDVAGFDEALAAPDPSTEEYKDILRTSLDLADTKGLKKFLEEENLDAIALPLASKRTVSIAAIAGYPIVNVPMGYYPSDTKIKYDNRNDRAKTGPFFPMALQFIGRRFDEVKIIGFAHAFQEATQIRKQRSPIILPKTELRDIVGRRIASENPPEAEL